LLSRFAKTIDFEDYAPTELLSIFQYFCRREQYEVTPDAERQLCYLLERAHEQRGVGFGNGRFVRNVFEEAIRRLADRVISIPNVSREQLVTITREDIPA
jgi:hypothetical protein